MQITLKEIVHSIPSKLDPQDKDYFLDLMLREFKEAINARRDFTIPHLGKFGIRPFHLSLVEELEKTHPNIVHEEKTLRHELFTEQIAKVVKLREDLSYEQVSTRFSGILKNVKRLDKK